MKALVEDLGDVLPADERLFNARAQEWQPFEKGAFGKHRAFLTWHHSRLLWLVGRGDAIDSHVFQEFERLKAGIITVKTGRTTDSNWST
jgi:hypothetical protein